VSLTVMRVGGDSSYDVVVGNDLAGLLPEMTAGASTVAVMHDPVVAARADAAVEALGAAGTAVRRLELPSGEDAKSVATLSRLWDELGDIPLTRSDAVVAVGGGATTDVVGFAAATWLRGVRVVHVPTTLLAMVDAAIGGKTGINTAAGKNLVGAFHPPAGVLVDLDVLATLPPAEWVNGMAEVVKAGFIADAELLGLVEQNAADAARPDGPDARELIERAIAVKVAVVSRDLREVGPREILNYGHTLGHAIELREGFRIPHGHAVSIGMVFAAGLGRAAGMLDDEMVERHRGVLEAVGLPVSYRGDALDELVDLMRVDKKARGATLRFVVLRDVAEPVALEGPEPTLLEAAYREVCRA
jgi:3-dehydroquinate synthase